MWIFPVWSSVLRVFLSGWTNQVLNRLFNKNTWSIFILCNYVCSVVMHAWCFSVGMDLNKWAPWMFQEADQVLDFFINIKGISTIWTCIFVRIYWFIIFVLFYLLLYYFPVNRSQCSLKTHAENARYSNEVWSKWLMDLPLFLSGCVVLVLKSVLVFGCIWYFMFGWVWFIPVVLPVFAGQAACRDTGMRSMDLWSSSPAGLSG